MSWSPELQIGEMRPWPDSVRVVRDKTGESRRYLPERTCEAEYSDCGDGTGALYCSECGGYMDENDRYCPHCGAKVVEQ